jgi:Transposase DDE domain group 1
MQSTVRRPKIRVSADGSGIVSHAGALLLTETARVTGLQAGLTGGLGRWRPGRAVHDPGKIVADLAVAVALGGDCLADAGVLRAEPILFGPVASDPVISRLIGRLAADTPAALEAIGQARAAARQRAWQLAGGTAPGAGGGQVVVDIDATIVTAQSEKEQAAPTWKKTYGFHPLTVFADHGPDGTGEPLAIVLRPGNAGSSTAADHITATKLALAQIPAAARRQVLIRADSGGGTHEFLDWLTRPGRRLQYSVGFTITDDAQQAIAKIPARAWTPAYDGDGQVRDGAWVAELTGLPDLHGWPKGLRVIVRRERPHPGRAAAVHRHRRPPVHCLRHLDPTRAARRPRTTPPAPRPLRGPHPLRQRHRAAQPASARLRPEPDLVPDRRPGLRPAGLDSDARPHRPRPPLGTQTPAAAAALRRRTHRPRRTPATAAPGRPMALDWPDHHGDRKAPGFCTRVASRSVPAGRKENITRARGTPPTRRDSREAINGTTLKTAIRPQPQATETRSRKFEAKTPLTDKRRKPAGHVPRHGVSGLHRVLGQRVVSDYAVSSAGCATSFGSGAALRSAMEPSDR